MDSFWHCFVGEKNDYYTLLIVLLFFEFCIRVDNLVRDCAVLIALGIDDKGKREVLGVQVSLSEAEVYWREFLGDSQKRGMHGTKLIISDAHSGIKAVRKAIMPGVA